MKKKSEEKQKPSKFEKQPRRGSQTLEVGGDNKE